MGLKEQIPRPNGHFPSSACIGRNWGAPKLFAYLLKTVSSASIEPAERLASVCNAVLAASSDPRKESLACSGQAFVFPGLAFANHFVINMQKACLTVRLLILD